MPPQRCIFMFPLESEYEEPSNSEEEPLLGVVTDKEIPKPPPVVQPIRKDTSKSLSWFGKLISTWRMIRWHILAFLVITSSLYATFHYGVDKKHKLIILQALTLADDWRQMAMFLGIYISFAVKKISDISSNIPPTDKIANLVSIAITKHRVQKAVMKYVCTALAMVFSFISPMVQKRLTSSEKSIKAKLEVQSTKVMKKIEKKLLNVNSSHFMPIKWSLHVIQEARGRNEVDERLMNSLINELNALHTQCDRLINFKKDTFSSGLTTGVLASVYTFFVVGAVRKFWTGLTEGFSREILAGTMTAHFFMFLAFLIILRYATQIVQPYNAEHDVFELNRILNEKLEVAAFVLNRDFDLRTKMKNQLLLP